MDVALDVINSVGFPIAVCIYLFISNERTVNRFNDRELALRSVLEENTKATTLLCERLEGVLK